VYFLKKGRKLPLSFSGTLNEYNAILLGCQGVKRKEPGGFAALCQTGSDRMGCWHMVAICYNNTARVEKFCCLFQESV